jgi:hypothetical protein
MPNKKAQRNNNRKTKRAAPKGSLVSDIDIEMAALIRGMAFCGAHDRSGCEVCSEIKQRLHILRVYKQAGKTRKDICCLNPDCETFKQTQWLLGSKN